MYMQIHGWSRYSKIPNQDDHHMHSHTGHEIYCFLSGDAYYMVEGTRYQLSPGDVLIMRRGETHHLILRSNTPYRRVIASFEDLSFLPDEMAERLLAPFNNRPLGEYNQYKAVQFPETHWVYYLEKIADSQKQDERMCYLLPLLNEISAAFETVKKNPSPDKTTTVAKIIEYINRHLWDDMTLSFLCEKFYISPAQINRLFREATGATVWKYITVKRLFLARELLEAGVSPTNVYAECGFNDYTTFYRAYKNYFDISPSSSYKKLK